jgi:hypothetical protein
MAVLSGKLSMCLTSTTVVGSMKAKKLNGTTLADSQRRCGRAALSKLPIRLTRAACMSVCGLRAARLLGVDQWMPLPSTVVTCLLAGPEIGTGQEDSSLKPLYYTARFRRTVRTMLGMSKHRNSTAFPHQQVRRKVAPQSQSMRLKNICMLGLVMRPGPGQPTQNFLRVIS